MYSEQITSQQPAIELLKSLGYNYLSTEEAQKQRKSLFNVILSDILKQKLIELNTYEYKSKKYKFSEKNINQAVKDLDEPLTDGLVKTNERIYDHLLLGRSYQEDLPDGSKRSFDLHYIDWQNINNNVFHITEEFSVERTTSGHARPDIVLFVNGIPIVVIECKKASVSVKEGISQTIRNQGKTWIPQLFKFVQLTLSINKNDGKFATCGSPEKYWSIWREEKQEWLNNQVAGLITEREPTFQDRMLVSMLSPERLMEFIQFFIIFDKDEKKIARFQQYFAVKAIMDTIKKSNKEGNRQGGVIWHTQGSGKSITMIMLSKCLIADKDIVDPKVVVVTDRINLDKQIRNNFAHTRMKPVRANSGKHLIDIIKTGKREIITTLVHKFELASKNKIVDYGRNIFVLVDESHRTQYGELHQYMKLVFPNACYLGFTGTPLMIREKRNTFRKFGSTKPIHSYTIADGVRDKTIVPLLYEGKMVDQSVNRKAIDTRLEMITRHLTESQTDEVKQKWSRFEKIASTIQRLELIAFDINEHFLKSYKNTEFKAMLATNSKYEAIQYHKAFEELGNLNTFVVISPPDQREGYEIPDEDSKKIVVEFWNEILKKYKTGEDYEEYVKDEFVYGEEVDILIVVDKLLTGFDAPKASVLYLDKPLKEHNLLQAIARVNRLSEGKDYGYIIDYRGLIKELDEAMEIYSGAGLEEFAGEDIKDVLYDVTKILADIEQYRSSIWELFEDVKNKKDIEEYEIILGDEKIREKFYDLVCNLGRNLSFAIESEEVFRAIGIEQLKKYKREFKFFQELRRNVKIRYFESIDHKEYELKMQKLMDNYVSAEEIIRITNPVDITDEDAFTKELERLSTPRAQAEAIQARLSKSIHKKMKENPAFFKKFSQRIAETIEAYKKHRISELEYLNKMKKILKDYREGRSGIDYPENILTNDHAKAFYGEIKSILEDNDLIKSSKEDISEESIGKLAIQTDEIIQSSIKVDWENNIEIHKHISQQLDDLLYDFLQMYEIKIDFDLIDKIIENILMIALSRYGNGTTRN